MSKSSILMIATLIFAIVTGLSDYLWLSIFTCIIGMALCIGEIAHRDGWLQ